MSIVSSCDGRQMGSDELAVQRHQSNTLFNVMRGGFPSDGYEIDVRAFAGHVQKLCRATFPRNRDFIASLGDKIPAGELHDRLLLPRR